VFIFMAHEIKTTGDLIEAIKSTDFIEQKHALVREWPCACCRGDILAGLVKGEGFAVDASVMEANASRYHGKAPDELDWTEKQQRKRAVAEYLAALEAEAAAEGDAQNDNESGGPEGKRRRYERQAPKVISPSDPQSAWTAKANKRVQFGYGLNYLIDIKNAVIVDVEGTPARTYDEVAATRTMLDRAEERFDLKPRRLAADTAYGTGKFLGWLVKEKKIIPHIPVWEMSDRQDGIFSRSEFHWDRKRATSAPMGNCLRPVAPCTTDAPCCTAPPSGTATCAQYERSAAPRPMRARSRATSMRTPAILHGGR
jgi:Transposase DDE domain